MAARGMWSGNISFGLVTIPVSVVSAENKSQELDFDLIDRRDKARVGYQKINKNTGKVIGGEDIVKGLKLDSGKYALFESDELAKLKLKGNSSIDIQQFVDREEIDPIYFKKSYYLVPGKGGQKTYVLLRETLLRSAKFAVGLIILHSRQQLVLIGANEDVLVLHAIHYAAEIKATKKLELPAAGMKSAKLSPKEIKMAERLVEDLSAPWKPTEYKDTYLQQIRSAVKSKARRKISLNEEEKASSASDESLAKVLDLIPLLEKSLKKSKGKSSSRPKAPRKTKVARSRTYH